jgi:hypothetical protein
MRLDGDDVSVTIEDCLFVNNSTSWGGGIWSWCGELLIRNCTIVSNRATTMWGGGLYVHPNSGPMTIINTIIYSNTALNNNCPNYAADTSNGVFFTNSCTMPLPTNSTGNITNYPQFADWSNNNYRLTDNSPCVNTGKNQAWMTRAVDLDGQRRIDRLSGLVDMGAYELIPEVTLFSGH